ncbi:MAG TPA: hypothetical protein IGS37_02475 [Synechococcales cyanobacterium M55_K2018_004]|nr:hypothetical protein [Synechococcales cyanobacterium M55_K2018_004]
MKLLSLQTLPSERVPRHLAIQTQVMLPLGDWPFLPHVFQAKQEERHR